MKSLGVYLVVVLLMGVVFAAWLVYRLPASPRSDVAWTTSQDRIMKQLDQVGD